MFALRDILNMETDKRIFKKLKKLKGKEAEVFLKEWRALYYKRKERLIHLRIDDIEECSHAINTIYQEFKLLGIRIP